MTARSKTDVQNTARKVLRDHGLYSIPVNPVVVANKLGLSVLRAAFSEPKYSGLTARRSGKVLLYIREGDPPARKRFTVAHEIGHALLHLGNDDEEITDTDADLFRTTESAQGEWTTHRRREYEANIFAAELLMPKEWVLQYWRHLPERDRTVGNMAAIFQVSESAMGIRLDELGLSENG